MKLKNIFNHLQEDIYNHNDSKIASNLFVDKNGVIVYLGWSKYGDVNILHFTGTKDELIENAHEWFKNNPEEKDNWCEALYQVMDEYIDLNIFDAGSE